MYDPKSKSLVLNLPWPPSVNSYWRHVMVKGQPVTMLSKAGRDYRTTAAGELLIQNAPCLNLSERLAVHIKAYPPDKRKRDLDNLPKGVLDALTNASVWKDDSQVDDLRVTRERIVKDGLVEITIATAKQPQQE